MKHLRELRTLSLYECMLNLYIMIEFVKPGFPTLVLRLGSIYGEIISCFMLVAYTN